MPNQFKISGGNLVSVVSCNESIPNIITAFKDQKDIYVNVPSGYKPVEYFFNKKDGRFHTHYVLLENKLGDKVFYSGYGDILSQRKLVAVNMAESFSSGWLGKSIYSSEIKFGNSSGDEYEIITREFGQGRNTSKYSFLTFDRKGMECQIELERLLH